MTNELVSNIIQQINKTFKRQITRIKYSPRLAYLGKGCILDIKRLIGGKNIFIGESVSIMWGSRIEAIKFYSGQQYNPKIYIGNNCAFGQNTHIVACGLIEIGKGTTVTSNVTIVDMVHPYDEIDISPRLTNAISYPVHIGEDCFINNGSVILPGTTLGKHCVVGANSVVKGKFGDYQILAGAPARIVKYYDTIRQEWIKPKLSS